MHLSYVWLGFRLLCIGFRASHGKTDTKLKPGSESNNRAPFPSAAGA